MKMIEDLYLTFRGILLFLTSLKKAPYQSIQITQERQYSKLRKLLLICENDIPYYQKLFREIDFQTMRDFKSLDDLKKIPITTKDVVRNHYEEFINPHYERKAMVFKTSGSTGEPMQVLVSKNQWIIEQGVVWRHWFWGGYKFRDKMAIVRSYSPKNGKLIKMDYIRNFRYYSPFHLSDECIKLYLEDMITQRIKVLRGYPSSVRALADYILKTECPIPKLKFILTASEVLTADDRNVIEKAFNCKVSNHYGLAEGIVMMGDCEYHNGMHNYDEYGYLELLDTDKTNIKQIIGTNLNNYAMPLLRYQTNDLAEYDNHKCGCGKNSIVINNIIGRSNSVIKLADRLIPLTNFYTVLEDYPSLKSWQIVQVDIEHLELRVSGKKEGQEDADICRKFRQRLPENINFRILYEANFIKKNEGKKPPFISLI